MLLGAMNTWDRRPLGAMALNTRPFRGLHPILDLISTDVKDRGRAVAEKGVNPKSLLMDITLPTTWSMRVNTLFCHLPLGFCPRTAYCSGASAGWDSVLRGSLPRTLVHLSGVYTLNLA